MKDGPSHTLLIGKMTELYLITCTEEPYGLPLQITRRAPSHIPVNPTDPNSPSFDLHTCTCKFPTGTAQVYVVVTQQRYGGLDQLTDEVLFPVFLTHSAAMVYQMKRAMQHHHIIAVTVLE